MTTPNPQPDPNQPTPADPIDYDDEAEQLVLTAPDAASTQRDFALWAGVLFLLALTIYSPALRGEFLWDDDRHVSHNANLRTADGLARIWTRLGAKNGGTPQYYPLTHTTYWIEYQLFGRGQGPATLNPIPFHVTNVLLHAGAATCLWFILRRLRVPGAWLAAAVFAVHPVHVESVAWISERKNVLSAVLMFGSILAYLRFARVGDDTDAFPRDASGTDDWRWYGVALGLFVLALLSKTVACSMPAVALLLIWWRRGTLGGGAVVRLLPFFVLGIAMAFLTSWIERKYVIGDHYEYGDWELSALQRVLIAGHALWFYFAKLIAPVKLTFTYPRWEVDAGDVLQWLFVLAAMAVPVALWALRRRIGRAPLAAALIYIGVLVPALGFFDVYPLRYSFVADHFQYHASPAIIALIVAGIVLAFRRLKTPADASNEQSPTQSPEQSPTPYIASGVLLLVLGAATWLQASNYADAVTLWRDTVAKNPGAWMAHHNLGYELTDIASQYQTLGDPQAQEHAWNLLDEAEAHLARAVQLRPQHDVAIMHWGRALLAKGRDAEAMAKFDEALRVNPENVEAMTNRGFMLRRGGELDAAIEAYTAALEMAERGPEELRVRTAHIGRLLGETYEQARRPQDAVEAFLRGLKSAPDSLDVRYDLGLLLARQGKQVEAADQFLIVLRRDPLHLDARISLALLMIEVGNLDSAQRELIDATRIAAQTRQNPPRLMDAAKLWDEAKRRAEAASTQPSTTQSSSTQSIATQPSTAPVSAAPTITAPTTTAPAVEATQSAP